MAKRFKAKRLDWTPELINRFREEHRFTLSSFGRAMGATGYIGTRPFNRQTVYGWESGRYLPSTDALRSLDALAERESFTP